MCGHAITQSQKVRPRTLLFLFARLRAVSILLLNTSKKESLRLRKVKRDCQTAGAVKSPATTLRPVGVKQWLTASVKAGNLFRQRPGGQYTQRIHVFAPSISIKPYGFLGAI